MTDRYSEDDVVAHVTLLTRQRLQAFVRAEVVIPLHSEGDIYFRQVDLARLELLCDLTEHFELPEDAVSIVMSLIDQLHGARSDLKALAKAVDAQPAEIRTQIAEALRRTG